MDDGTTPKELLDPPDERLQRFYERSVEAQKQEELENEFKHLSNLKKDIVRRKIRKLIRRNNREIKRNQTNQ